MPFSRPKLRHDSKHFARTGFHNFIILIMLNTIVVSFNFFLQNFKFVILLRAALYRPLLYHSKCVVPFRKFGALYHQNKYRIRHQCKTVKFKLSHVFQRHYDNTYKDFTYNDSPYNINKYNIQTICFYLLL
jgi:hypothetical protein